MRARAPNAPPELLHPKLCPPTLGSGTQAACLHPQPGSQTAQAGVTSGPVKPGSSTRVRASKNHVIWPPFRLCAPISRCKLCTRDTRGEGGGRWRGQAPMGWPPITPSHTHTPHTLTPPTPTHSHPTWPLGREGGSGVAHVRAPAHAPRTSRHSTHTQPSHPPHHTHSPMCA